MPGHTYNIVCWSDILTDPYISLHMAPTSIFMFFTVFVRGIAPPKTSPNTGTWNQGCRKGRVEPNFRPIGASLRLLPDAERTRHDDTAAATVAAWACHC